LALGTKPVSLVFVPPLLAAAFICVLFGSAAARSKVIRAMSIVAIPLLTGGFWYLRNLIITGNPLYPIEARLLSRTIWAGWYGAEAMRQSVYYIPFTEWRALGDTLLAVLDPRLAPIWIGALCYCVLRLRANGVENRHRLRFLTFLSVLNIILFWVCIPYRTQQRFMLHGLGLAAAPLAAILDRSRLLRLLAAALLALHVLTPQTWPFAAREDAIPWDLSRQIPNVISAPLPLLSRLETALAAPGSTASIAGVGLMVAIIAAAFGAASVWQVVCRRPYRTGRRLLGAVALTGVFVLAGWCELWSAGFDRRFEFYPPFPDFYVGWRHLEARSGPRGCRVAYAGTNLPYYLLGNHLRNDVFYVNVDEHQDWLMHDYHRDARLRGEGRWPNPRPGWDRQRPDYSSWVRNLESAGIQLLVVTRVNPSEGRHNVADPEGFPIERRWADSHPDQFELLYGQAEHDPWFRLYGFRPVKPGVAATGDGGFGGRRIGQPTARRRSEMPGAAGPGRAYAIERRLRGFCDFRHHPHGFASREAHI
jgi:hypothetical protein